MTFRFKLIIGMAIAAALIIATQSAAADFEIEGLDIRERIVTIRLSPALANGSDGACEQAAQLFWAIAKTSYTVFVLPPRGEWFVPTAHNPITPEWAEFLAADTQ